MEKEIKNADELAAIFKVHKNTIANWNLPSHTMTPNSRIKFYIWEEVMEHLRSTK